MFDIYPSAGTQRASAKNKDWYYFSNISISFSVGSAGLSAIKTRDNNLDVPSMFFNRAFHRKIEQLDSLSIYKIRYWLLTNIIIYEKNSCFDFLFNVIGWDTLRPKIECRSFCRILKLPGRPSGQIIYV